MENKPGTGEGCEQKMQAKYINPFTDFGFKKLFGEEASKELLLDFLNSLLPIKEKIVDLSFSDKEQLGEIPASRNAVYDIYCRDSSGKFFIVEMQNARQLYFKDRAVFYSTFPIREQAEKGEWNFKLQPVYCIGLLGFEFADKKEPGYLHEVKLKDQQNQIFYEKLTYIFIELPKFNKDEDELENRFDQWLYFLKNLEDFEKIPDILSEKVFEKAFIISEIANFSREQQLAYEESLKIYRDNLNTLETARIEGEEEGRKEGRKEELQKTIIILLLTKFNLRKLPEDVEQKIRNNDIRTLENIGDNIFGLTKMEDINLYL